MGNQKKYNQTYLTWKVFAAIGKQQPLDVGYSCVLKTSNLFAIGVIRIGNTVIDDNKQ